MKISKKFLTKIGEFLTKNKNIEPSKNLTVSICFANGKMLLRVWRIHFKSQHFNFIANIF